MIKKITLLLAIATVSATITVAQSFTALYTFDSVKAPATIPVVIIGSGLVDPTPVPTATGVTFGSFSATGTPANPNSSFRFNFTGWALDPTTPFDDVYASLTGAINTSEYYEVTVTPSPGFTITLSNITFKIQRSGTGIRTYAVRSSVDNFITNLSASISPANTKLSVQTGDVFFWNLDSTTTGQTGSTITLSGSGFTNITSPITFGFYGWNAEATGGTFSIDDVTFTGSASGATAVTAFSNEVSTSIYPNPSTNGVFTVDVENSSNKTIIAVYDIIGKVILTKELNSSGKQTIDLSNEANGSYFVNIKNDKENITKKIIYIKGF